MLTMSGLIFNMFFCVFLFSFLQGNGYKPTPLDLTTIQLNEKMLELVDLLAENTHNVWAKDRIKHGWTYGLYEVCCTIQCHLLS